MNFDHQEKHRNQMYSRHSELSLKMNTVFRILYPHVLVIMKLSGSRHVDEKKPYFFINIYYNLAGFIMLAEYKKQEK